ncbi:GntR family transcriptional regulator [Nocardioides sp. C4-1]|uniref:GntR family transcriptional regulator n=1 Tax=Nocardioides sp. C4-1 TaxID=3151851 RepID=UPI003266B340
MSAGLRLSGSSSTPVYQQIVQQVRFLVEAGELRQGERLPSARQLADNLGVNRNTVAKAYALLRDRGVIETRGAAGTVVTAAADLSLASVRDRASELLAEPVRAAVALGLSPDDVGQLALHLAGQHHAGHPAVVFAECNDERATSFAKDISERLHLDVEPSLITELDDKAADCDLLVTTFFHLAEVRRWARGRSVETVAVVVTPHLQTLMTIASLPAGARVGVRYTTEHQNDQVRDWLADAGSAEVVVVPRDGAVPADLDLLVVPHEHPELGDDAAPATRVVPFGGELDDASVRTLEEVLADIRRRA